jgi:hypothetical protein
VILTQGQSAGGGGGGARGGPIASRPTAEAARPGPRAGRRGAECAGYGAAADGAPALRSRPGPPAEYHGPKGVPSGRLRRGETHRFDAATVRWCGGSMQWRAAVSLPEKGSVVVPEKGSPVPKLWGGKGEVRAASIGEGRPRRGRTPERDGRWNSGVNPQWEGWLQRPREGGRRR